VQLLDNVYHHAMSGEVQDQKWAGFAQAVDSVHLTGSA
jgi:hypothetical protein